MVTVTYVGPTVITVLGPPNIITSNYPVSCWFKYVEADGTEHMINAAGNVAHDADDSDYKAVADAAMAAYNLTY